MGEIHNNKMLVITEVTPTPAIYHLKDSAGEDGHGGPRSRVCTLGPPLTPAEFFWRTCLQCQLQTSLPTPQKSYEHKCCDPGHHACPG